MAAAPAENTTSSLQVLPGCSVHIHTGPNRRSNKIGKLTERQIINVLEEKQGWVRHHLGWTYNSRSLKQYNPRCFSEENPIRVLFVCTSNTCRSPMAEGVAKAYFQAKNIPAIVGSAGLTDDYEKPGTEASAHSVTSIKELANIDISDHKSRIMVPNHEYETMLNKYSAEFLLTEDDVAALDKIYCVSSGHVRWIGETMGADPEKVMDLGRGIPDPWHGPLWEYQECAQAVKKQVDARLDTLLEELQGS